MLKLSLTRKDLESFASNTLGFRETSLRRMSTLFLGQLLQLQLSGDNALDQMAHEVKCLERDPSGTPSGGRCVDDLGHEMNEWVVFKRHNGTNYYLAMARISDGDQSIHQRIRDAYEFDFPYLRGNA